MLCTEIRTPMVEMGYPRPFRKGGNRIDPMPKPAVVRINIRMILMRSHRKTPAFDSAADGSPTPPPSCLVGNTTRMVQQAPHAILLTRADRVKADEERRQH